MSRDLVAVTTAGGEALDLGEVVNVGPDVGAGVAKAQRAVGEGVVVVTRGGRVRGWGEGDGAREVD